MPDNSLKTKTKNGLIWNAIDKFAVQGTNFLIGLFLARLLIPSDYGLIGMLALFLFVSQVLVEGGFSSALIQKHTPDNDDYSTVFYFNLAVAVVFYLILFFTAPLIAAFYNVPSLILITRVVSLSIIIVALSIVQQTKLTISLDFKTQAKVSALAVLISGVLSVYAAYHGYGVWSLVIQTLSSTFIRTLMLFYFNKWIPAPVFSTSSFKNLFRFSSRLLASTFLSTLVLHMYSILIGKYYNARELGFYTNAKQFPELLGGTIGNVLLGVTFPVMASLQNERERMVLVYARLMRVTVFFVMPMLTLFALLSEPFIRIILTEKWMPAVPLIQWLCFAYMITPINILNVNSLNASGRSDLYLKVVLIRLLFSLATLLITIPFGLKAIVIGNFSATIIAFFINTYYPGKIFGYGAIKQLREMFPVAVATIIMTIGIITLKHFVHNDIAVLILCSIAGSVIFFLSALIMKIEELKDIKELIHTLLSSKLNIFNKQYVRDE